LEYLHATGLLYAQTSFVEVCDDRDEHGGLCDPWLTAGNLGYSCAAFLASNHH
jgi:hypothetical protein